MHVREHFPEINLLISNAGIQRGIDLTKGTAELPDLESNC